MSVWGSPELRLIQCMTLPKPLGQDPQDPAVFLASLGAPMLISGPCLLCFVLQSTWFLLVALLPAVDLTVWLAAGFTCLPTEDQ